MTGGFVHEWIWPAGGPGGVYGDVLGNALYLVVGIVVGMLTQKRVRRRFKRSISLYNEDLHAKLDRAIKLSEHIIHHHPDIPNQDRDGNLLIKEEK